VTKVSILDASAVLAYLLEEKGQDHVEAALNEAACWLSTVNMCEVLGKLHETGMPPQEAQATLDELGLNIVGFDADLAARAAFLRLTTKTIGASLGDRACLALAERTTQIRSTTTIVLTAEQVWTRLKWPFRIVLVR